MYLSDDAFSKVVELTPLVSIDLLIQNDAGAVLLGRRINRPAQGYWFVPGGRILKDEPLDAAFQRLTKAELGYAFERHEARLLGVYEHFYPDSFFPADAEVSTHYIALGYHLILPAVASLSLPLVQHAEYRWWKFPAAVTSPLVHSNTRAYLDTLR